jgi:hypothetical protein
MPVTSAQRLLEADLDRPEFRIGVDKGHWALAESVSEAQWPAVFTWITAAARTAGPTRWLVRWDVADYNAQRPTGAFWDSEKKTFLDTGSWPKCQPGSVGAGVFKIEGWAAPGRGFYHPYDRLAWAGHEEQWTKAHPEFLWTAANTLTDFITLVHRWLTNEAYLGS